MPRRDGTGPMAAGPMSGRGLGRCSGVNVFKYDAGLGIGLGPGLAYRRVLVDVLQQARIFLKHKRSCSKNKELD